MLKKALILIAIIIVTSSTTSEDELYLDYVSAVETSGTFQKFLVVKVRKLNTGITREYCTHGNFLKGALHREYNIGYTKRGISKVQSIAIKNKERYFEFKNDSAIWDIGGVWFYSIDELEVLQQKIDFDSLKSVIIEKGKWKKELFDDKLMLMYAHSLFN